MSINPWSVFYGPNIGYIEEQYETFLHHPERVDEELKQLFKQWGAPNQNKGTQPKIAEESTSQNNSDTQDLQTIVQAIQLAEDIRKNGHLTADIYPLKEKNREAIDLDLEQYHLTEEDLRKLPASLICAKAPEGIQNGLEAIHYLKDLYTRTVAFEFAHIHDRNEKQWLDEMVEMGTIFRPLSERKKIELLTRLTEVDGFEKFLHRTFVGQKRFSIEGLDTLVPLLDDIISKSVRAGTTNINIGMAHRGRLNVLAHTLEKPYKMIFSEFQNAPNKELVPSEGSIGINYGWTGDVKYHLGADKKIRDENTMGARLTLANNPSHLEFVNPIVEGFTRAAQDNRDKSGYPTQDKNRSLAILIHGDAAFPGQGIVAETLNLSRLKGYQTGGTIHIIANNMIGFTTESEDSRSTRYASDLAKGYEIPIIHVNADDPEACLAASLLAYEYRSKFNKDFLIDLIGYRRFGHNEMDEPVATNPAMYRLIHAHPTVREVYCSQLIEEQIMTEDEVEAIKDKHQQILKEAYEQVDSKQESSLDEMNPPDKVENGIPAIKTSVSIEVLRSINDNLVKWPEGFHVFKKIEKILSRRLESLGDTGTIDWSLAETLAFATILNENTPIRMTGQDSERGTFSQRHLILHDSDTGETYSPLHLINNDQASFAIYNSPLSEAAVLGFEYGYNVFAPETLVIWEAQYGDFANSAQVIFDQFISAGRAKWGQKSGLVMLLPHGYEGQGPEHSSGRLERWLTSAAENNWTVANVTSAAQYFHILRRQAAILTREEVKPLILMTPKSLLRNQQTASTVQDLCEGSFESIVDQDGLGEDPNTVERIVCCTGKIAIDIEQQVKKMDDSNWLHILRLEEIYPFPLEDFKNRLSSYPNLKEIVWVQEEPKNMGAWTFVEPRIKAAAPEQISVEYIGRIRRSSPAGGDPNKHKRNQERIISKAITRK